MKAYFIGLFAFCVILSSALKTPVRLIAQKRDVLSLYSTHLFASKIHQSSKKVRVKLLQDTPHGKKNEIVMISNALWNNVIQPKRLGERISDIAFAIMKQQALDQAAKEVEYAKGFVAKMTSSDIIIPIAKEVGPTGQLFGSVNPKLIIEHIKKCISGFDDIIDSKAFHVIGLFEYNHEDKSAIRYENLPEIRKAGKYRIRVKVHPKVEIAEFDLIVGA